MFGVGVVYLPGQWLSPREQLSLTGRGPWRDWLFKDAALHCCFSRTRSVFIVYHFGLDAAMRCSTTTPMIKSTRRHLFRGRPII